LSIWFGRWARRSLPGGSFGEIKDEIEGFGSGAGIRLRVFLVFFNKLENNVNKNLLSTLGWLPGQDDVRTFFQGTGRETEIPVYDHPK